MKDWFDMDEQMCYLPFTIAQEPCSPATIVAEVNEKNLAESESEEAYPSVSGSRLPPWSYPPQYLDGTMELVEFGTSAEPTPKISTVFIIETGRSQKNSVPKQKPSHDSKVTRGNNPTGRAGRLRCDQCRTWKVKCEYENVESPCSSCIKKGRECDEKQSAQCWKAMRQARGCLAINSKRPNRSSRIDAIVFKSRQLRPSVHESLTSSEVIYIQSLRDNDGLFRFANLQFSRSDRHRLSEIVFRRFGGSLDSRPVRYGCILYSLYKYKNEFYNDDCYSDYLNRFYRSSRKAITQKDVAGLVYSCFAGSMYAARTERTFEEFETHARGFLASVSDFAPLETEEMFLLECMREKLVWTGAQQFLFKPQWSSNDLRPVTDALTPLLHDSVLQNDEPQWIQEASSEVQLKLQFIRTVVQLYSHSRRFKYSELLKESMVKRFSRDFVTPIKTQPNTSRDEIARLRSLLRDLWSRLLDFVSILTFESGLCELLDQRSVRKILSIYLIIDRIPKQPIFDAVSIELGNLIDIAIYTLVLVGLSTIGLPDEYLFGSFSRVRKLMRQFSIVHEIDLCTGGMSGEMELPFCILSIQRSLNCLFIGEHQPSTILKWKGCCWDGLKSVPENYCD